MLKVIQPIKGRVRIWRHSIPPWDLCIRPHYPLLLWVAKIGRRWSWSWRYPRNNLRLSPSFPCFTLCRRWRKGTASASFPGEQREWKVQGVLGASGFSRDQFWSPWLSETVQIQDQEVPVTNPIETPLEPPWALGPGGGGWGATHTLHQTASPSARCSR